MQNFRIFTEDEPQAVTDSHHLTDGLENVSFIKAQFNSHSFYVAADDSEPFTLSVRTA